jgi:hypothetical protein
LADILRVHNHLACNYQQKQEKEYHNDAAHSNDFNERSHHTRDDTCYLMQPDQFLDV